MSYLLNIAYLGKRDYIDVSTLSSALYEALPDITVDTKIRNFKIRLLKKVEYKCELLLRVGEDPVLDPAMKRRASVIFNWDFEDKNYTAYFLDTPELINERVDEIVDDPKNHMRYENSEVIIYNPINDDCIYNLMKMGRLIVVNKYNLFPRVVRFHFDRFYNKVEMKDIVMTAEFFATKDFYKLETIKDGKKFGEIIIKGLQPY